MRRYWRMILFPLYKRRLAAAAIGPDEHARCLRQHEEMVEMCCCGLTGPPDYLRSKKLSPELWEQDREEIRCFLNEFYEAADRILDLWGVSRNYRNEDIEKLCDLLKQIEPR
jgi:hypothetical protein